MDPQEFVETVREESATPLSRLGSSKALYADTEGEMDDDAVLGAAADRAHFAAERFDAWGEEESGDVSELFADAAATERDHAEAAADERGEYEPGDAPAVVAHLDGVSGTAERLGAFVGWALAAGNNADQVVGYFVGQASPRTASTFRAFGGDYDEYVERASELLAAEADDPDDAVAAAAGAIEADYEDYFETLEELGVNPKPVC
ncbi:rubrerythrin family protein [Halosimplex pelagicum]|uniref:Rubrerythrin family protein n=1 Tax=Halosimplex pelagicum TaxID=869886 RepID=A0A7D5TRU5_9EURY|nr:rubrerythrin family protein [Halosimplex pelagicum]QLH81552.1 rubrerythrin family protein [Halosimplex pelagicum]